MTRTPGVVGKVQSPALLAVILALLLFAPMARGQGWYSSWQYRKQITISHGQVSGSSNLANFPVLISLPSDSNLAAGAQSSGNDILFTDSSGTNKLNHEIEQYTSSTGKLIAWVQVPSVSPTTDTVIYMYYGNSSASNQQNAAGTWDSNYKLVMHFAAGTALSTADSTSNGNNGTLSSDAPTATTGQIGGGVNFANTLGSYCPNTPCQYIRNASPQNWPTQGGPLSLEFWMNSASNASQWNIFNLYDSGTDYTSFLLYSSNTVMWAYDGGSWQAYATAPSANTWHHIVYTSADSGVSGRALYVDGANVGTYPNYADPTVSVASYDIGALSNGYSPFDGSMDELRVSNTPRAAGWVVTEYNNQNAPSGFYSVGSQQSNGGGTVSITVTSAPTGLTVTVDGTNCTTPCAAVQWTPGSNHTIAAANQGGASTQYVFASWSDGGAASHSVTAPSSATTYTATFTTQYYLTTVASPSGDGSISPASEWVNAGTVVAVSATASSGYQFTGFSGALSGTTTPQNLTMSAAQTVTASFTTASGPNYTTSYTYDLLNHLTGVSMTRAGVTQTRAFVYSGNLLMSATNPENGTVNYTYNVNQKVATRTDAKGQEVVYSYDSYARLTKVQRYPQGPSGAEDLCQQEDYYYDGANPVGSSYPTNAQGHLSAVQYWGAYNVNTGNPCDTTFTELYNYGTPGAPVGKQLQISRANISQTINLTASFTYDTEGRMTGESYPTDNNGATANLGYTFDSMGRLSTLTDNIANQQIIQGATYGPANELLTITGGTGITPWAGETRIYNSLKQLTQLTSGGLNIQYNYPSPTGNNGKIVSQTDVNSGETVTYAYDALNRLASAATQSNFSGAWGQSFTYDGFGNLTNVNVTQGSAPTLAVSYDPSTNHPNAAGSNVDANGNPGYIPVPAEGGGNYMAAYDVENRLTGAAGVLYCYAPGNKRIWRGNAARSLDVVTFWSVSGQKLADYALTTTTSSFYATQTETNYYFGSKLIKNGNGWVYSDRLGSVGKFYPYGIERPSATANGTEKFTGYFRDAETGNDYAVNRYMSPGTGRYLTPDTVSGSPSNPGSWNLYAYVAGDPIDHSDPSGQAWCSIGAESFDGCDAVGPDQNGICYVLTELGADMALLGGQGCGEVVWGDPGTLSGGGGNGPCGGVLAFVGSGCGSGGSGSTGQPQQQLVTCTIALYERGVPFRGSPASHTYLVLTETNASGTTTQIIEAGPSMRPSLRHPKSWGNLVENNPNNNPNSALGGTNPSKNEEIGFESGGADVCADLGIVQDWVAFYNMGSKVAYSPTPNGLTTFNSNSYTYTLLYDAGLNSVFGPYVAADWAPGWGQLVPGLYNP